MAQKAAPPSLPARMCFSALGGMGAACFCHPLDVLRVSMQVAETRQSSLATAKHIYKSSGMRGLYNGLSAAFLRQWTYGSCRVGIYSWLLASEKKEHGGQDPTLLKKMGFGVISGGIGSFIGTPSELSLVRMGADSRLPPEERRGYRGVGDCLRRIAKEEGPTVLCKGSSVLSATVLGTTSELKVRLPEVSGGLLRPHSPETLLLATVLASPAATFTSQPFDVVKSRIQNMPAPKPGAPAIYSGSLDCARKIVAKEGPLVLMKGYTPAFIKLAPYTTISLALTEFITKLVTGAEAL